MSTLTDIEVFYLPAEVGSRVLSEMAGEHNHYHRDNGKNYELDEGLEDPYGDQCRDGYRQ